MIRNESRIKKRRTGYSKTQTLWSAYARRMQPKD